MSAQSVDKLLDTILASVKSTTKSVDSLIETIDSAEVPALVADLQSESSSSNESGESSRIEGMSLLSLKNSSLLGYLNSLALIVGTRIQDMNYKKDVTEDAAHQRAVATSVLHRLTLDKGVKPLEKKLNYQLDKLMDSYRRREKEQKDVEERHANGEDDEDDDEGSSSDDEEEGLNFRPDASAVLKKSRAARESRRSGAVGKYKPPRISAALPPDAAQPKEKRQRNLQSMDEFLQEVGDAPAVEGSIGTTITDHGRDMKSKKQIEKEAEIQRYEEENFVRLPQSKSKESSKDRKKRLRNEFMGEDWSMFENSRDINAESTGKRRKKQNAWQRAKRQM